MKFHYTTLKNSIYHVLHSVFDAQLRLREKENL